MNAYTQLFPEPYAADLFSRSGVSAAGSPAGIRLQPENVRNGLAQLVLTLVELLRELLERQALRRIDAGGLTAAEVERLGTTFLRLAEEIESDVLDLQRKLAPADSAETS